MNKRIKNSLLIMVLFISSPLWGMNGISVPTTISMAGTYTVVDPIPAPGITISGDDITLNLNNYQVTGLNITGSNVLVKNGTVNGSSDAIRIENTSNVYLEDILAQNATQVSASNPGAGVHFINTSNSGIKDSIVANNQLGIKIEDSVKITVDSVIANCNVRRGISLVSSFTCCVRESKALGTGTNNAGSADAAGSSDIIGFEAIGGNANIFEGCIANDTKGLRTTNFCTSLVAGFALRADANLIAEECSKIIHCEAGNATTASTGFNVPYGIIAQSYCATPGFITVVNKAPIPDLATTVIAVDWSPDQKHIAVGYGSSVSIFSFDQVSNVLQKIADATPAPGSTISDMRWSPDGTFIAVATQAPLVHVYQYCAKNCTLTLAATCNVAPFGVLTRLDWHPSGRYLAVASDAPAIFTYELDRVNKTLMQLEAFTSDMVGEVLDLDWSPDGNFLAIGMDDLGMPRRNLRVYRFTSDKTLVLLSTKTVSIGEVSTVHWSPDQKYIAAAGDCDTIEIYGVTDGIIGTVGGSYIIPNTITSFAWSADSRYLVVGSLSNAGAEEIQMLKFDRSISLATLAVTLKAVPNESPDGDVYAVAWSPDGQFVVAGTSDPGRELIIYRALSFPHKNVISNNLLYDNAGNKCPGGVGLSGSSVANLIVGNTAYANPYTKNGNVPLVPSNYEFVTNVFKSQFDDVPTDLQNRCMAFQTPLCAPEDVALSLKQSKFKLCSLADGLMGSMEDLCAPQPIFAADIPTTITTSGFYCLGENATNTSVSDDAITIAVPNVTLDLNGHTLASTMRDVISAVGLSNVTVRNGTLVGNAASSGVAMSGSNINLEHVVVQNALIGVNFDTVVDGAISYCTFTQNTTGLELDGCANITLDHCVASRNMNAGFCLLSSTTNCLRDCKALSTGDGNTNVLNQTVFGFVSTDGNANIFERCIANSTQALSTTDFNSLVSGFALRGNEQCSKIIECESANATTSPEGVTVPYGILLEATVNNPITLTTTALPQPGTPISVEWSPDGKFVLVADGVDNQVFVYAFDRIDRTLLRIATGSPAPTNSLWASWSPDGTYVAVADGTQILVYCFDSQVNSLMQVAQLTASANTLAWSFDGRFIVVQSTPSIAVYAFDRVANTLALNATGSPSLTSVFSVSWSPDDQYIAVANSGAGAVGIYEFTSATNSLIQVTSLSLGSPERAEWSFDGKYIVVADNIANEVRVYEFDKDALSLVQIATGNPAPSNLFYAQWSPDGRYVAVADTVDNIVRLYKFDRGVPALDQVATSLSFGTPTDARWSPDGQYLVVIDGVNGRVYDVLIFPSKNVIKDNTVYCNSGASIPSGIGISGSSIANLIIGNTAYCNPIPQSETEGGGPIVSSNYQFVTNVFNQLFGQAPTDLQNISIDCNQPICMPEDLGLLLKQIKAKVCNMESILDTLPSALDVGCVTQEITTATTIDSPGFYCVANDLSDAGTIITINSDDVVIDLNNHVLNHTGVNFGIDIQADNVTILNGSIQIAASSSTSIRGVAPAPLHNITLKNIHTSGGTFGTAWVVDGALVEDCSFNEASLGFANVNCANLVVKNCLAMRNMTAGFDLLNSATCCFINCKAFSTGEGVTNPSEPEIVGFSSRGGYANVFENCIANDTHGFVVNDGNSFISGFALRNGEDCSKIINCESANTSVAQDGATISYGIFLEGSIENPMTLTAFPTIPADTVTNLDWHPSGKYIATSSGTSQVDVNVYTFDYTDRIVSRIVQNTQKPTGAITDMKWSPDGTYIAITNLTTTPATDTYDLRVYEFSATNNTLTLVAQSLVTSSLGLNALAWSPDSRYIAVGDRAGDNVAVIAFDRINTVLTTVIPLSSITTGVISGLDWNPDGKFLAGAIGTRVVAFEVDIAGGSFGTPTIQTVTFAVAVAWNPNGKYLAAGSIPAATLHVYPFDADTPALGSPATITLDTYSVDWSSDGRYVAAAVTDSLLPQIHVYQYNPFTNSLGSVLSTADFAPNAQSEIAWSPDGQFIASGGDQLYVYHVQTFPQKNVIKDNTVYCNGVGGSCPRGIGISGSSISNMIIGNAAYANPIAPIGGIDFNYAYVTNVFQPSYAQGFGGQATSILQNISLGGCEAICQPEDPIILAKQIKAKVSCVPIAITAADIPTTISGAGVYCLAEDVSDATPITINADDVALHLNNHVVTGTAEGISILSGHSNVSISNGRVVAGASSSAINVLNGFNINIHNMKTQSSLIGIHFDGVMGGSISNCTLTQNTTGIELDSCANIRIDHCIANQNINAGYCLLSSVTNCLRDCKALSTGDGNTNVLEQTVFGFVSSNGYGNIFERCIANSTQALSTTDSQSLVAGFALRGSEGCTKIIECESANATTSPEGVTVPYGILLEAMTNDPIVSIANASPVPSEPTSVSWSPDGKYLVVSDGDNLGSNVFVYQFDSVAGTLNNQITASPAPTESESVSWSPDGRYIAVADQGSNDVFVYQFDSVAGTLNNQIAASPAPANPLMVTWSPDGHYIAVADDGSDVFVYQFDSVAGTLNNQIAASPGLSAPLSVSWSPDGHYIAVADEGSNDVFVYQFDSVAGTLSNQITASPAPANPYWVAWSPDGHYIAVADFASNVFVYQFDRGAGTLSNQITASPAPANPYSVAWSPDGKYVAVGTDDITSHFFVYEFDRGAGTLGNQIAASPISGSRPIGWSPDGRYVAVPNHVAGQVYIYDVLTFPSKNVIMDNTVYCNSGGRIPSGIGISGSSIANMIIGNTSYSNPLPQANTESAGPIVFSNYVFVTNQFNQLFQQAPTDLQNIGLEPCQPICQPCDLATLLKQDRSLIELLITKALQL